jgi:hypothetical protein
VALREFVPSATALLPLAAGGERTVTLGTVLPTAVAALVRGDGRTFVGMQVQTHSGDISRDLGQAVRWALTAEPGNSLPVVGSDMLEEASRLQDLLSVDEPLEVELHRDFSWWLPDEEKPSGEVAMSLERANAAILPTERVSAEGVVAAYWVDAGEKAHLRWVRPEPEELLLAAMARLAARGELDLGEGSRYAGCFRAHGLLVPVWDLDREQHAREWASPAVALGARLAEALASSDTQTLSESERRALAGLRGRQVTLR